MSPILSWVQCVKVHATSMVWQRGIMYNAVMTILEHSLQWRHNERDGISNHQPHDCLLSHSFRRRTKKTSKLPVTGLCVPVTGEFPTQRASNVENVYIWWRHHVIRFYTLKRHHIWSLLKWKEDQFGLKDISLLNKPYDFIPFFLDKLWVIYWGNFKKTSTNIPA